MGLSYSTVQRTEIDFHEISTVFWVNLGMSVLLVAVMVIIAPALSWFYGDPRLRLIAMVTALGLLFGGLAVQHEALLRRQMRFFTLSVIAFVAYNTEHRRQRRHHTGYNTCFTVVVSSGKVSTS